MNKPALTLLVALVLASSVRASGDELLSIESFNATYTAYKASVEARDYERAVVEAKRAYKIGVEIFDEQSPNPPKLAFNYGAMLSQVQNFRAAKPVLEEALGMYESRYGHDSAKLIPTLMQLAYASADKFDSKDQRKLYDRALDLASRHYGSNSRKYGELLLTAGQGILNRSEPLDSKRYLTDAREVLSATAGVDDSATGVAAFNLARLELSRKRYGHAQTYLLEALESFEDPNKPDSAIELSTHAFLVTTYQELGQPKMADRHCLAIGRMTPYNEDQDYFPLYRKAPRFPSAPLRRRLEGFVDIEFSVDEAGVVREPVVVDSHGQAAFVEAALDAIGEFRYAPRFVDGEPVLTQNVRQRFTFNISR